MRIAFKTLRWKNFLSTGNVFTELKLDQHSNSLVVGTNGAGKSTMLDALTFSLFGKPFRGINKPNLVNSINGKDCVVEVLFKSNNKSYKVSNMSNFHTAMTHESYTKAHYKDDKNIKFEGLRIITHTKYASEKVLFESGSDAIMSK